VLSQIRRHRVERLEQTREYPLVGRHQGIRRFHRIEVDCAVVGVDDEQADAVRVLTAVADATGSTTLGLDGHYCADGVCRTNVGNRWMFKDGMHITQAESGALAPTFAEVFEALTLDGQRVPSAVQA
jgi:hypothetical protein